MLENGLGRFAADGNGEVIENHQACSATAPPDATADRPGYQGVSQATHHDAAAHFAKDTLAVAEAGRPVGTEKQLKAVGVVHFLPFRFGFSASGSSNPAKVFRSTPNVRASLMA